MNKARGEYQVDRFLMLKNIEDATGQCLEVRAERGMPLTMSVREVEIAVA